MTQDSALTAIQPGTGSDRAAELARFAPPADSGGPAGDVARGPDRIEGTLTLGQEGLPDEEVIQLGDMRTPEARERLQQAMDRLGTDPNGVGRLQLRDGQGREWTATARAGRDADGNDLGDRTEITLGGAGLNGPRAAERLSANGAANASASGAGVRAIGAGRNAAGWLGAAIGNGLGSAPELVQEMMQDPARAQTQSGPGLGG